MNTAEVGSRSPAGDSVDELQDMAGNVWEWTDSWYDADLDDRVLRGGGWNANDSDLRTDSRLNNDPTNQSRYQGFRCARALS